MLRPVDRPEALGDQVYRALRDSLGTHAIVPGQRLLEPALALQLGVSRTPVREALARLASEGLIAAEGRGYVVPVLTDPDVDEIYELRALLEPAALARAAAGSAPAAVAAIAEALKDAEAAERDGDAEAFIEANARFHAGWHALVGNRRLIRAIALYAGHVRYLRVMTLHDGDARRAALAGMRRILAALRRRDAARAAEVMRDHLGVARHHLRLVLDRVRRDAALATNAAE